MSEERTIVTISKENLNALPAAEFKGRIRIIDRDFQVEEAIKDLRKNSLIGFDTETRPSFRKGQSYKLALVQLSTPDCCYLFRTCKIGIPEPLKEILEDPAVTKVGLSVHDDFHSLHKLSPIEPQSFIELQQMVKEYKIADNSLSRIYGILFGKRICKGQRLTNWEAETLTDAQQSYAALDAFACIEIYNHLMEGKFDPSQSPYLTTLQETEANELPNEECE